MPPAVVMPEASLPRQPDDEVLTPAQLEKISLFAQLSRKPSFAKLPGTIVLRRFRAGQEIVRQGAAGWTAFYILKRSDVLELRRAQQAAAQRQLALGPGAQASPQWRERLEARLASLD